MGLLLFAIHFFFSYKNLVYKNIKAWNCFKIKNIVVILLVAISISFEGFGQKMMFLWEKKCMWSPDDYAECVGLLLLTICKWRRMYCITHPGTIPRSYNNKEKQKKQTRTFFGVYFIGDQLVTESFPTFGGSFVWNFVSDAESRSRKWNDSRVAGCQYRPLCHHHLYQTTTSNQ